MERKCIVSDGTYSIYPVSDEDMEAYKEIANQDMEDLSLHFNGTHDDLVWDTIMSGLYDVYMIYEGTECCGIIDLFDMKTRTPELGIRISIHKQNQGIGPKSIKMLLNKLYSPETMDYFLVRIHSSNSHSRHVFEKLGAIYMETEPSRIDEQIAKLINEDGPEKHRDMLEFLQELKEKEDLTMAYKLVPGEE